MDHAAARVRLARALIWVVPALWSSNYLVARLADGVIAPHALASARWTLAALLMLPIVGRGLLRDTAWLRREWAHLLVLGALGMWICGAWVYLAARSTTATNIGLIYAVTPVATAAVSAQLLHERMSRWQWLGVVDYGEHWFLIASAIGLSLVGVVTFGTLVGALLPFLLQRLGLDPATSSAPFVATLVDVTGLVIYFSIAYQILHGTLL